MHLLVIRPGEEEEREKQRKFAADGRRASGQNDSRRGDGAPTGWEGATARGGERAEATYAVVDAPGWTNGSAVGVDDTAPGER